SLERMCDCVIDGRSFVSAMHHAVGAFLVISGAVRIPIGFVHKLVERLGIAFAKQIAGLLPSKYRPRRIAPRRAVVTLVSRKKIEKQARLAERPARGAPPAEYVAEELLCAIAIEKVLLIGRSLVSIARRNRDAV